MQKVYNLKIHQQNMIPKKQKQNYIHCQVLCITYFASLICVSLLMISQTNRAVSNFLIAPAAMVYHFVVRDWLLRIKRDATELWGDHLLCSRPMEFTVEATFPRRGSQRPKQGIL